jgi:hypothetical protein
MAGVDTQVVQKFARLRYGPAQRTECLLRDSPCTGLMMLTFQSVGIMEMHASRMFLCMR